MIPEEVKQAGAKARQLTLSAGEAQAAEPSVTDALRQRIQEAYSQNQDITDRLDTASGKYFTAPAEGRAQYQNIFSPFEREKLTAQYTQQAALPMLSLSSLLGNRLGRIEDLIGGGVRGYQAQTARQSAQAQFAQQAYQDLLNQYQIEQQLQAQQRAEQAAKAQSERQIVEIGGHKWLINPLTGQKLVDLGVSGTGGSAGADLSGIGDYLAELMGRGQNSGGGGSEWEDVTDEENYGFQNAGDETLNSVTFGNQQPQSTYNPSGFLNTLRSIIPSNILGFSRPLVGIGF